MVNMGQLGFSTWVKCFSFRLAILESSGKPVKSTSHSISIGFLYVNMLLKYFSGGWNWP